MAEALSKSYWWPIVDAIRTENFGEIVAMAEQLHMLKQSLCA